LKDNLLITTPFAVFDQLKRFVIHAKQIKWKRAVAFMMPVLMGVTSCDICRGQAPGFDEPCSVLHITSVTGLPKGPVTVKWVSELPYHKFYVRIYGDTLTQLLGDTYVEDVNTATFAIQPTAGINFTVRVISPIPSAELGDCSTDYIVSGKVVSPKTATPTVQPKPPKPPPPPSTNVPKPSATVKAIIPIIVPIRATSTLAIPR
jgi:hypothetical protein